MLAFITSKLAFPPKPKLFTTYTFLSLTFSNISLALSTGKLSFVPILNIITLVNESLLDDK